MKYDEFIKAHIGKAMDYDGCAGAQCVDLAKYYLDEVFGIKPGNWGDAHDYYDGFYAHNELVQNFDRIPNTPKFVPKKGDICVWKSSLSSGGWGHIAIATGEGDTNHFYSYDQNWTGNHDACARIYHNYNHFAGVLRAKDQSKVTGVLKPTRVLDSTGLKKGDRGVGVLAFKCLLIIAKKQGYIKRTINLNGNYTSGVEAIVKYFQNKWGYVDNGIAGQKFINKMLSAILLKIK
ncbi:MAG: CHAP domain-containing protein [Oscillospiraceae bacterium]